jgi:DNA-binding beta-propeller fold protein YncE
VPASTNNTVHVIDPDTFQVIATYPTAAIPHHVTPSWDLSVLYVLNTGGNSLLVLDPATGAPINEIAVIDPYNLYFTPDGENAIVVAERLRRLDIRDPVSWELKAQVSVPWPGVDHMAFSPEGDYLVASTEFSGRVVKINTQTWAVTGEPLAVGGEPIDVVRTPGQRLMLVANQGAGFGGVHVIDPDTMTEVKWIPTGAGAHGILLSHDQTQVYVSNRLEGSISIVDLATLEVVDRWEIPGGGSPDMGQLNIEGDEFWIAGRFHSEVYVFDTATGELKARIPTDSGPHGLTYFPSHPYPHSIGHNGVYWMD